MALYLKAGTVKLRFFCGARLTALRSPWQNPLVERMLGSIQRECLDHVIVLDEQHLRRILRKYVDYYHSCLCLLFIHPRAPNLINLRSAGTMPA